MESLTQNKALLFSLTSCGAVILFLTGGLLPEVAMHFEIVDFPSEVSLTRVEKNLQQKRNVIYQVSSWATMSLNMFFFFFYYVLQFRTVLAQILIADLVFAYIVDRTCLWLFGEGKQHELWWNYYFSSITKSFVRDFLLSILFHVKSWQYFCIF